MRLGLTCLHGVDDAQDMLRMNIVFSRICALCTGCTMLKKCSEWTLSLAEYVHVHRLGHIGLDLTSSGWDWRGDPKDLMGSGRDDAQEMLRMNIVFSRICACAPFWSHRTRSDVIWMDARMDQNHYCLHQVIQNRSTGSSLNLNQSRGNPKDSHIRRHNHLGEGRRSETIGARELQKWTLSKRRI